MNPVDHLQFAWIAGNVADFDRRERWLLMFSAFTPDIDSAGGLRFWDSEAFETIHHTFGHNIFWVVGAAAVLTIFTKRRRLLLFGLFLFFGLLHIFIDQSTSSIWPIRYLWPLDKSDFNWAVIFQMEPAELDTILRVYVQLTLKALLILGTVIIYIRHKRTFLEFISVRLDKFLTDFAILPFKNRCFAEECLNRGHYRCDTCGKVGCIKHSDISRGLGITCTECHADATADLG